MEFVNKLHEKTVILIFKILDPQPPAVFTGAQSFPFQKTPGTVALVITSPEDSSTSSIQPFYHSFWEEVGRHEVDGESPKNGINQNQAATSAQKLSFPT